MAISRWDDAIQVDFSVWEVANLYDKVNDVVREIDI